MKKNKSQAEILFMRVNERYIKRDLNKAVKKNKGALRQTVFGVGLWITCGKLVDKWREEGCGRGLACKFFKKSSKKSNEIGNFLLKMNF